MEGTVKLVVHDVEKPKTSLSWQTLLLGLVGIPAVGFGLYGICNWLRNRSKPSSTEKEEPKSQDSLTKLEDVPVVKKSCLQNAQDIKDAGNKFFKDGKYVDAIRCYSEAIELCPSSEVNTLSTFYQNRAAAYDQLGNLEDTVKDCTTALGLNNRYTKALSRRAKALKSLGKLSECLEDVTAVCILENFTNQKSLEMADSVLKELGKVLATEALQNQEPIQPSPFFVKSYFTSFPNDPVIKASDFNVVEVNKTLSQETSLSHLERAKEMLFRGRYDEVIPICSEAVEQGEGLEPEALLLRATMYILRGQHLLAMEDLNMIINSEVQNTKITVNALIKRASLHLQVSDIEKTLKDFEIAENLDPNNPDIYLHRGQVTLLTENLEQSIKDFKKCVSLDPNCALAVMQGHYAEYRQAVAEKSMSGITKAIEKFKRVIRKHPQCSEAFILLAQILADQQQFDEADKYFQSAQEIDSNNASLRVHRGLLQLQWKGDIDTAINYINDGIKVDDKCSFCYETLGTIEVQRGNLQNAVGLFNKAIPLCKTEMELSHIFSLRQAAVAQQVVAEKLGLLTERINK